MIEARLQFILLRDLVRYFDITVKGWMEGVSCKFPKEI